MTRSRSARYMSMLARELPCRAICSRSLRPIRTVIPRCSKASREARLARATTSCSHCPATRSASIATGVVRDARGDVLGTSFLDALDAAWRGRAHRAHEQPAICRFAAAGCSISAMSSLGRSNRSCVCRVAARARCRSRSRCAVPAAIIVDHVRGCRRSSSRRKVTSDLLDAIAVDIRERTRRRLSWSLQTRPRR